MPKQNIIRLVYIILGANVLFFLIKLLVKLKKMGKNASMLGQQVDGIKAKLDSMSKKKEYIDHSVSTSYSFFAVIFGIYLIIKKAIKDYRDTDDKKKSVSKSLFNGYVHQGSMAKHLLSGIKK